MSNSTLSAGLGKGSASAFTDHAALVFDESAFHFIPSKRRHVVSKRKRPT